jgi:hypothetical protein
VLRLLRTGAVSSDKKGEGKEGQRGFHLMRSLMPRRHRLLQEDR